MIKVLQKKWAQLPKNRSTKRAATFLLSMLFIAVFARFIANDKPYLCAYEQTWHAPVFKELAVDLGISKWPVDQINKRWAKQAYDWAIWPPVHYSALQKDLKNRNVGPFDEQKIEHFTDRHWLGTDNRGHDVLAGLIWGTRIAFLISLGAISIATLIGILLGAMAGYFGDSQYQTNRQGLIGVLLGSTIGFYAGFITQQGLWHQHQRLSYIFISLIVFVLSIIIFNLLFKRITLGAWARKSITIPIDTLVMRLIETLNALPGLLLLLSIVAIVPRPSIWNIIVILGLLGWTGIARFTRGELLRIRSLEYIQAAKTLGFSHARILWRHALPNALAPVFVSLTFAVAAVILIEASLSFLGIGTPNDIMSWGKLLSSARESSESWWLAIFPGLAISATILMLYQLGQGLSQQQKV